MSVQITKPGEHFSPTKYFNIYAMKESEVRALRQAIYNTGFINQVSTFFSDKTKCINSVRVYPIDFSSLFGDSPSEFLQAGGAALVYGSSQNVYGHRFSPTDDTIFDVVLTVYEGIPFDYDNDLSGIPKSVLYGGKAKASLYLPFHGYIDIDPLRVVDKKITIKCVVDLITGNGTYYIISGEPLISTFNYILETVDVQLGTDLPLVDGGFSELNKNIFLSLLSSNPKNAKTAMQNPAGVVSGVYSSRVGREVAPLTASGGAPFTNMFTPEKCHAVIFYPVPTQDPEDETFKATNGKPLYQTKNLDDLSGYTELSDFHLENFSTATSEELTRLESLLKGGVIL